MENEQLINRDSVKKFAKKIKSQGALEIIPVIISISSSSKSSYDNVIKETQTQGGIGVYGWIISRTTSNATEILKADANAVWKDVNGDKFFISSKNFNASNLIFLQDTTNINQNDKTNYRFSPYASENYKKLLELEEYINSEIIDYICLHCEEITSPEKINLEKLKLNNGILLLEYEDKKYQILYSRMINLYKILEKINEIRQSSSSLITFDASLCAEELLQSLNYKFKYTDIDIT